MIQNLRRIGRQLGHHRRRQLLGRPRVSDAYAEYRLLARTRVQQTHGCTESGHGADLGIVKADIDHFIYGHDQHVWRRSIGAIHGPDLERLSPACDQLNAADVELGILTRLLFVEIELKVVRVSRRGITGKGH